MLYLFMHKLLLRDTEDDHNLAAAFYSRNENTKFQCYHTRYLSSSTS